MIKIHSTSAMVFGGRSHADGVTPPVINQKYGLFGEVSDVATAEFVAAVLRTTPRGINRQQDIIAAAPAFAREIERHVAHHCKNDTRYIWKETDRAIADLIQCIDNGGGEGYVFSGCSNKFFSKEDLAAFLETC